MSDEWNVEEGTGWINVPDFGRINPRRDNVDGGRQFFTAMTNNDEHARVRGDSVSAGPETWHFEFDQPFLLSDGGEKCLEVTISLLKGGRYAVKHREGHWPSDDDRAW